MDYNMRWLKTEYHHTVATAQSVEKWKQYERDADLYPNLKYNAVNDARTREKHKALDGLILPITHVFWKTHSTPLDWGCRCSLEQTDEDESKVVPNFDVKPMFKNNAALTGKVFGDMPYLLTKTQQKEAEDLLGNSKKVEAAKQEYNAIKSKYKKEFFNTENGGYLAINNDRIENSKINKNETAKFLKEKKMATTFANSGMKIKLLGEVPGVSSADALADGMLADLKQTSSHNNILKYVKKAQKRQGAKIVLFEFTKKTPEILKEIENLKKSKSKIMYYFTGDENIILKTF